MGRVRGIQGYTLTEYPQTHPQVGPMKWGYEGATAAGVDTATCSIPVYMYTWASASCTVAMLFFSLVVRLAPEGRLVVASRDSDCVWVTAVRGVLAGRAHWQCVQLLKSSGPVVLGLSH